MSTLLYFGLHCLPYFPPHQLGMLEHSALAHSVWQRRASSSRFCEPPCQLCFLGPQSNTEGRGPRYPSSQQDLECDLLPARMFFNSWINEHAAGFIIRACLCQVFYNSSDRLRPAAPGACRHTRKVNLFRIFIPHILSPYCYATWQLVV